MVLEGLPTSKVIIWAMERIRVDSLLLATNICTEMNVLKVEEVWWHIFHLWFLQNV